MAQGEKKFSPLQSHTHLKCYYYNPSPELFCNICIYFVISLLPLFLGK